MENSITKSAFTFKGSVLDGEAVERSTRRLGDLEGIFADRKAFSEMDPSMEIYRVASAMPVPQGTPGGLYMGITYLSPGKVGDEYFMTKGHFHTNPDSAEFYWGLEGEGMLILMDAERNVRAEKMVPGSLHYIPAGVAHRVANTGAVELVFAASWPSDAGHDYNSIVRDGFARRLVEKDGKPELI